MKYTHKIVRAKTNEAKGYVEGALYSEHTSEALAEKALNKLIAMSKGKMSRDSFRIEPI